MQILKNDNILKMSISNDSMNQYKVVAWYNCEVDELVMTVHKYKKSCITLFYKKSFYQMLLI